MSDKRRISGYVSEAEHTTIKAKADAADCSISEWVVEACREKIEREDTEAIAREYRIEERLLQSIDAAADRASDQIVEQVLSELDGTADSDDGSIAGKSEDSLSGTSENIVEFD
jgi:hypothetical protein